MFVSRLSRLSLPVGSPPNDAGFPIEPSKVTVLFMPCAEMVLLSLSELATGRSKTCSISDGGMGESSATIVPTLDAPSAVQLSLSPLALSGECRLIDHVPITRQVLVVNQ